MAVLIVLVVVLVVQMVAVLLVINMATGGSQITVTLQEVVEENGDPAEAAQNNGGDRNETRPGEINARPVSAEGGCGRIHGKVLAGFHQGVLRVSAGGEGEDSVLNPRDLWEWRQIV